jgi:proline racemase
VKRVKTTNVPCYVDTQDIEIEVDGLGPVKTSICYGGAFFALVETTQINIEIERENARRLVEAGEAIKAAVRNTIHPVHPTLGDVGGVTFVTFTGPTERTENGLISKNASVISPGKIDRSPCGTASSARVALMYAKGELAAGESIRFRSILDTEFELRIEKTQSIGAFDAVVPSISGRAWITGQHSHYLDPLDPFPEGYSLADTAFQVY